MRLQAQTALIENGFVHIPETAPWLAEYLHEMTVFPKGKHDEVDSTAQFLLRGALRPHHGERIRRRPHAFPVTCPPKSTRTQSRLAHWPFGILVSLLRDMR
jgi:hypothetical protein